MAATTGARRMIRWAVRHGLVRHLARARARRGAPAARLLFDPDVAADPFPFYETVRTHGRLLDTGVVLTTADHALCTAILRSSDFRTAAHDTSNLPRPIRLAVRAGGPGPLGPVEPPSMLATDGPAHTRYRKLVTRAFSARAIAALRGRTEAIAEELLDAMAARGPQADLVADYASLLPATVITEMLGAPPSMRRQFLAWGAGGALSLDVGLTYREFRRAERDIESLQRWMLGHFATIRGRARTGADQPADLDPDDDAGLLTTLVAAHDAGRLSDDELSSIAMLVLAAGFETTVNLIGNGVAQLTAHPDQRALLAERPELWPTAVDEVLRYDSPVQRTGRLACRDTEVDGVAVPAGQVVVLLLGGANRDPAVFADPRRFDLTRTDAAEHIAFSSGPHYCLGAGLARMEGEVALRALYRRFPDLTPAGTPHRRPTRVLRGFDAMPVDLRRRAHVSA